MTLFALDTREDLAGIRFAWSPVWETLAAVRSFTAVEARAYHEPWHRLVRERASQLDLEPLLALQPHHGFVPDFLTPPPATASPRLRDQLAAIRATPAAQVAYELELCRTTVDEPAYRRLIDSYLAHPERARDLLAARVEKAWSELIAPFWIRIQTLLDRDIEHHSRTFARQGLRHALDDLDPRIRWTKRGLSCSDRMNRTVELDQRGLVLMPSAYLWPHVAAVTEEPWQPTIVYPARGIAELWRTRIPPPDPLARLLGRTRAIVLANLDSPLSTTALAKLINLSPAGTSRHLLALHDAGLAATTRQGHEVRYSRTALGSALIHAPRT